LKFYDPSVTQLHKNYFTFHMFMLH